MLATVQPCAAGTRLPILYEKPSSLLYEGDTHLFRSFWLSPSPDPLSLRTMSGQHHMNNTCSMHHTHPIYIPENIVEKHRTEAVLLLGLHSPDSADLPPLAVLYRRRLAEIRPYSRWRIYVSLYIRYWRVRANGSYMHSVQRWEFLSTIWFEWSFISGNRPYRWSVWVSIDRDLSDMSLSHNRTLGLWGDTHSHPCERVDQPDPERLE